ncbi:Peptidase M8 [Trypanosoma melophagium]|uniref:Peptidase M8 n=1 Tax=Trypanosoma melophagium TaxID=715481 RepID=UPI003519DEC5|nr:Peptidase M8 [Trypanosoma melophagium]KAH9584312.1 Peptidase M8 [Trypanosoma melophagium]
MTRRRQMQGSVLPLLLLLFILLGSCGCLAFRGNRCMFDELALKDENINFMRTSVVYELPRPGERRLKAAKYLLADRDWSPIRIAVSAEDLENESMYCNRVGETRPNFRGEMVNCEEADVITVEKRETLLKTIIPKAIKLHADPL